MPKTSERQALFGKSRCRPPKIQTLTTKALNKKNTNLELKSFHEKPCLLDNFSQKIRQKHISRTLKLEKHRTDAEGY